MQEQMEMVKRMVSSAKTGGDLLFERIRATVQVENDDLNSDYLLVINANEISIKPMNNSESRLAPEDLGFQVYGRNVAAREGLFRELLKTCRTQLRAKRQNRLLEELKTEEIESIKEASAGSDLPDGWFFDGRQYMTFDGDVLYEHPNVDKIIATYLANENAKIDAYNREVE